MKLLLILGLIINVAGFGEIPAEGLHIELTQAEEDPLTGEMRMDVNGTLLCSSALSVSITRSEAGLEDEFCCADQCTPGNGEQTELLAFMPGGMANWFAHYTPALNSDVNIVYVFSDGSETRTLTVRYLYSAEGIDAVQSKQTKMQKILKDGILYIEKDNKTYTVL